MSRVFKSKVSKFLLCIIVAMIVVLIYLTVPAAAQYKWTENQVRVHEIANHARSLGLPEDNPIIVECQRLWNEYAVEYEVPDYSADAELIAKILYTESRGLSDEENELVAWCILNRVDAGFGASVYDVVTAPGQFAYRANAPVTDRLLEIADKVLYSYYTGGTPLIYEPYATSSNYLYFYGNGKHNYFRSKF